MPYKKIGVIGAVALLRRLAMNDKKTSTATSSSSSTNTMTTSSSTINQDDDEEDEGWDNAGLIQPILSNVVKFCRGSPEIRAFYYDEIADSLSSGTMCRQAALWISERLAGVLEETFLGDYDEEDDTKTTTEQSQQQDEPQLQSKHLFNLDDEDASVCVNIFSLVCESDARRRESLTWLPSLFRAVACAEKCARDGDMDNVDAPLGCPILGFDLNATSSFETLSRADKERVVLTLLHTANWLRELVNAFATQNDREMQFKVFKRVKHLVRVERELRKCLGSNPELYSALGVKTKRMKSSGKKQKKQRVESENSVEKENEEEGKDDNNKVADEEEEEDQEENKSKSTTSRKRKRKTVPKQCTSSSTSSSSLWKQLRDTKIRPLGPDAAIVLGFKVVRHSEGNTSVENDTQTHDEGALKLSNADILLLLEELHDNVLCKIKDSKTGSSSCGPFAARRDANHERPRTKMLRDKNLKSILQSLTLNVFTSVRRVLDDVLSSMRSRSSHEIDDDDDDDDDEMDIVITRETEIVETRILDTILRMVAAICQCSDIDVESLIGVLAALTKIDMSKSVRTTVVARLHDVCVASYVWRFV